MRRRNRGYRRRASGYLVILGAATMVTIIGLSALLAVRVEGHTAALAEDMVKARISAASAMEVVVLEITNNPNWRSTSQNKTWAWAASVDGVDYSFMFVDEDDGDLADDPTDSVRVYARAIAGDASRTYSVLLDVDGLDLSANLLSNAGMEDGLTDWVAGGCGFMADYDEPHSGALSVWVRNREGTWAGPAQSVLGTITNGGTYELEVWVKMKEHSETVSLGFWGRTDCGWSSFEAASVQGKKGEWTFISGSVTPDWPDTVREAYVLISTVASSQEFWIDDVAMFEVDATPPTYHPVAGTWRREIVP